MVPVVRDKAADRVAFLDDDRVLDEVAPLTAILALFVLAVRDVRTTAFARRCTALLWVLATRSWPARPVRARIALVRATLDSMARGPRRLFAIAAIARLKADGRGARSLAARLVVRTAAVLPVVPIRLVNLAERAVAVAVDAFGVSVAVAAAAGAEAIAPVAASEGRTLNGGAAGTLFIKLDDRESLPGADVFNAFKGWPLAGKNADDVLPLGCPGDAIRPNNFRPEENGSPEVLATAGG
ncbi:MAG TPA: hypothetical protein VJ719_08945 [Chthoniobacterales bacterium]|nr:hypothetical protein [Chthoniobacterales bacterium]